MPFEVGDICVDIYDKSFVKIIKIGHKVEQITAYVSDVDGRYFFVPVRRLRIATVQEQDSVVFSE